MLQMIAILFALESCTLIPLKVRMVDIFLLILYQLNGFV